MSSTDAPQVRELARLTGELSEALDALSFSDPVHTVYDPWQYAREGMRAYYARLPSRARVFFLGMNPGPWGMAQTGVPFGEISMVRDWLGMEPEIGKPENEHPKRPVEGMACGRSEVSGTRLWGLMRDRFGTADRFFKDQVILPYCHWMWLKETGANQPPNQIRVAERKPLEAACDRFLAGVLELFAPEHLVAIGQYAESALRRARPEAEIVRILHPSPASPAANRGWAEQVSRTLEEAGIWEEG